MTGPVRPVNGVAKMRAKPKANDPKTKTKPSRNFMNPIVHPPSVFHSFYIIVVIDNNIQSTLTVEGG